MNRLLSGCMGCVAATASGLTILSPDVPAGAGIYYLIFSNKAAPKTSKAVHATVLLRYKSWLPDWFRMMKGRVLDWIGFD